MKAITKQITTGPDGERPAGTVIDHPDSHLLCRLGVADPADDECQAIYDTWRKWKAERDAKLARDKIESAQRKLAQRRAEFVAKLVT